jgi:hypothetical protein
MAKTLLEHFGEVLEPSIPAEWLSDNGSGYIARETHRRPPTSACCTLNAVPIAAEQRHSRCL